MAQYVERLFPNVAVLHPRGGDEGEDKFWGFVNRYISHSRATRAHALVAHQEKPPFENLKYLATFREYFSIC
jgi:hypothetical protein